MQLHEILNKSKKKISLEKVAFRKAEISYEDRPYKENNFVLNGRQTDDKRETIIGQTRDALCDTDTSLPLNTDSTKRTTKGRQTDDKRETIIGQTRDALCDTDTSLPLNTDSEIKEKNNIVLYGNEKKIWDFLKKKCIYEINKTIPLTKKDIIEGVNIPNSCLKKTLERVIKKGLLSVHISQSGRFGWRVFEVS